MNEYDRERFLIGINDVIAPMRPDRDEWVQPIEKHLETLGLSISRRLLVESWERFSGSRDAGWLDGDDMETVVEFVEWVISRNHLNL